MIKLFSLKNQQQNEAKQGNTGGKRASAAQLRVQKGKICLYISPLSCKRKKFLCIFQIDFIEHFLFLIDQCSKFFPLERISFVSALNNHYN